MQLTGSRFSRLLTQHLKLLLEELKQAEICCKCVSQTHTLRTPWERNLTIDLWLADRIYPKVAWASFFSYFYAVLHNHTAGSRPENMEKSSV